MNEFGNGIYTVDINNTIKITFSLFCSYSPREQTQGLLHARPVSFIELQPILSLF